VETRCERDEMVHWQEREGKIEGKGDFFAVKSYTGLRGFAVGASTYGHLTLS